MVTRRLALLDWDNTLRPGFTIVDWTSFLASRDQYNKRITERIAAAVESYSQHQLSYAELSVLGATLYASGIAGQSVPRIQDSAADFVKDDQQNLFSFTHPFLTLLADEKIDVYIVSGCPSEILVAYSPILGWQRDYGLEAEHKNGYYTGNVAANRASIEGKQLVVAAVTRRGRALLAAGDSASDLPLLENAKIKLIFDNPQLLQSESGVYHLDPFTTVTDMVGTVRELLRMESINDDRGLSVTTQC